MADKILVNIIILDMSESIDRYQYGNQKGLSVNHYFINIINKIVSSVDKNSQAERISVIQSMVDWSRAFERQSHS